MVEAAPARLPPGGEAQGVVGFSFWSQFWRRFLRNRAAVSAAAVLLLLLAAAALAPVLAPADPASIVTRDRLLPPGSLSRVNPQLHYWLGTDNTGRDILSRLLFGGRVSMTVGLITAAISISIGTVVGATAGYYGGAVDNVLMRCVDFLLITPRLPLIIIILTVFPRSLLLLLLLLGLTAWGGVARLVRAEYLSLRTRDFVEAARAQGASDRRIIFRHILPSAMAPLIVNATFQVAGTILLESVLSFLGLGVQPPTASWGNMLFGAQDILAVAPWTSILPGLAISVAVLSFNLLGDGLRDALDPRLT